MAKKPTLDEMRLALTRGKTKHEHAHEKARLNAIKMLGLHEKNTAQDRAKAMGFDLETFHGTDAPDIESLDPERTKIIKGVFSTTNPKTASRYAEDERKRAQEKTAPNVLPLLIKSASHETIPKYDINTINAYKNRGAKGVYRPEMQTAVTFDPSHIRSRFAAFDPERQHDTDLLAAKGGEVLSQKKRKENLKKFLSPSKVKEKLYHATPKDFKEFQGEGFDPTISGNATWLSTDPHHQPAMHNISGGREAQFREGTNVMPVHVQAKVPLYLDDKGMIEYARAAYAKGHSEFPDLLTPETVRLLKEDGYDSIIHADPYKVGRAHEIIMLEPKRIKSAIGNRGTYDPNDPDITKAKGGEVLPHHQREENKAKFLEPSKVKDVLFRGQRRSPKPDRFVTTQDRSTPSFTTNPDVANVYSKQLGWDIKHGLGSTSVPVHIQTKKPFDIRHLGEHVALDDFVNQMNHDFTVPTHSKKLGYKDLADILWTLDHHVFKGGAKHEIYAHDSKGYKIKGFDKLADEIMSAGNKKDVNRILHELLQDSSVDAYALADSPELVHHLKKQGYDSMIHKDVFDAGMPYYEGDPNKIEEGYDAEHVIDAYRPFHQGKIKSAIGNRGTYDTTDPDITKAQGGNVKPKYPSIEEMLQKLREAGRTPVMPAPDRWFKHPEKHPFQQKAIEKLLEHTGHGREAFPFGAHINPITGEPLDFEIMNDLGVAIDPNTGNPMMSGIKSGLTEIDPKLGSLTKSNLIRKGLFKHEGGDPLLDRIKFLATIEKSGKGHHYGLSTQYASPAELVQEMKGNPTLRPHSRGDIYGVGDEIGRISIKGMHHPVYEKLLVAPTGSNVQGKKLHKAKGGQVTHAHHLEIEERPL